MQARECTHLNNGWVVCLRYYILCISICKNSVYISVLTVVISVDVLSGHLFKVKECILNNLEQKV